MRLCFEHKHASLHPNHSPPDPASSGPARPRPLVLLTRVLFTLLAETNRDSNGHKTGTLGPIIPR